MHQADTGSLKSRYFVVRRQPAHGNKNGYQKGNRNGEQHKRRQEKKNNLYYGKNTDALIDNQIHDLKDFPHKQNKSQNE